MFKICPICGETFKVVSKRGRPQIYCSKECRRKGEFIKRKEDRLFEKKCEYCGKTFMGNGKTVYCSDECAKKQQQDYMSKYHYDRYQHDEEYKQQKLENTIGTFNLSDNLDENGERDWEKEYQMIKALKKQAGLK